jgi:hypothetical protein
MMLAQLCRSLAHSIDAGNRKGRAIANESAQLQATLRVVQGLDVDELPTGQLPPELAELLAAFSTRPTIEPAPA